MHLCVWSTARSLLWSLAVVGRKVLWNLSFQRHGCSSLPLIPDRPEFTIGPLGTMCQSTRLKSKHICSSLISGWKGCNGEMKFIVLFEYYFVLLIVCFCLLVGWFYKYGSGVFRCSVAKWADVWMLCPKLRLNSVVTFFLKSHVDVQNIVYT